MVPVDSGWQPRKVLALGASPPRCMLAEDVSRRKVGSKRWRAFVGGAAAVAYLEESAESGRPSHLYEVLPLDAPAHAVFDLERPFTPDEAKDATTRSAARDATLAAFLPVLAEVLASGPEFVEGVHYGAYGAAAA